jgi:high-affinity Fe2+/Pb2+ permease
MWRLHAARLLAWTSKELLRLVRLLLEAAAGVLLLLLVAAGMLLVAAGRLRRATIPGHARARGCAHHALLRVHAELLLLLLLLHAWGHAVHATALHAGLLVLLLLVVLVLLLHVRRRRRRRLPRHPEPHLLMHQEGRRAGQAAQAAGGRLAKQVLQAGRATCSTGVRLKTPGAPWGCV